MTAYQDEREQLGQVEELFRQKKFAEGLSRIEEVLRRFPTSFHLRFLKYKLLRELKQDDAALELLSQMHALSGDNILVVKELADLHFHLKQFRESLLYYKKLLFLDSFNGQAQERIKLLEGMIAAEAAGTESEPPSDVVHGRSDVEIAEPPVFASAPSIEPEPPPMVVDETVETPVAPPVDRAAPGVEEPHFQTESAAELYFNQGLYREALAIYKNLFEKTGRTDYFLKIKSILSLLHTDRNQCVMDRLQQFLHALQQRGTQIV